MIYFHTFYIQIMIIVLYDVWHYLWWGDMCQIRIYLFLKIQTKWRRFYRGICCLMSKSCIKCGSFEIVKKEEIFYCANCDLSFCMYGDKKWKNFFTLSCLLWDFCWYWQTHFLDTNFLHSPPNRYLTSTWRMYICSRIGKVTTKILFLR